MNKLLTLLTVLGLSVVMIGCTEAKAPPKADSKPAAKLGKPADSTKDAKAAANGHAEEKPKAAPAKEEPKKEEPKAEVKKEEPKKEEPKKEEPKADEKK